MYPVGGFVFVRVTKEWSDDIINQHGPYKVLKFFRPFDFSSNWYYELEDTNQHYKESEVVGASAEEELYHKLTQHIEEEQ